VTLKKAFDNSGLVEVSHKDLHSLDFPELDEESNIVMLRLIEQIVKGDVARGGVPGLSTLEDADRHYNAVKKELEEGRTVGWGLRLIWGQKEDVRRRSNY